MYKLENNVEWTTELKNAFKHGITKAKIIYDTNTEINYDNGLKEVILEDNRYVPEVGFIGQATARKVTLTLLDNLQLTNLENKEFSLYIGADYNNQTYYINYGNFIVDEIPENDSTNGTIKIIAYDYMIKFNQLYENNSVFPCTLKQYLEDICGLAGVTLGTNSFPNDSFIVTDNQFEGKQLREVLQHICKCAFGWARIGQDNKLYLDFEVDDTVDETITIDDYKMDGFKKANEYYGYINRVIYGDTDITGQEEYVDDPNRPVAQYGEKAIVINDNYFAYTAAKRQALIQNGSHLFGLRYMPVTQLKLVGLIYLDCTDIIKIMDENENYVTTRVLSHTIKYNGIVSDEISSEAQSNNQKIYENQNSAQSNSIRTEIMVDRNKKEIQSIIEDIGDRSQKTSTITQDIDRIESSVSDIEDLTNVVSGNSTVTISDAYPNSNILELHIYGNNSVFDYLYPSNNLYPSDDLLPYGDSRIRFHNSIEDKTIELGIDEVLRANLEVRDEVFIQDRDVYLIRRVNSDGTTKLVETTTLLGQLDFVLQEGNNTFEIVNYDARIEVRYAMKSNLTSLFATKIEMNSTISQTVNEINAVVSHKVDENEIVAKLNLAVEDGQGIVRLIGNTVTIDSDNFKLYEDGSIQARNGIFQGDINMEAGNWLTIKDSQDTTYMTMNEGGIGFYEQDNQTNAICRTYIVNNNEYEYGVTIKATDNTSYVGISYENTSILDYRAKTDTLTFYKFPQIYGTVSGILSVKDSAGSATIKISVDNGLIVGWEVFN